MTTIRPARRPMRAAAIAAALTLAAVTGAVAPVAHAEIGAGRRLCLEIPGATPGDLAIVNLTPVAATAPGNGVLTSSDTTTAPTASNVNFAPGTVDPNVATATIGSDGFVCFHTSDTATVHLVADLQTVVAADAVSSTAGEPVRLADTRTGLAGDAIAPGERRCFPTDATPGDLAVVNLTPVAATAPGNGVLNSSDTTTAPTASNVNYAPGRVDPNLAVTTIGADGDVCFHNSIHATVHLVADLLTTLHADTVSSSTDAPVRLLDTRTASPMAPGERRCFPTGATPEDLAIVNLTPVAATAPGNGVLTSSDTTTAPSASNVNFAPGTVDPNVATTTIGTDGEICFHNSNQATVHLVADLLTTLHADAVVPIALPLPTRLVDTRGLVRNAVTCPTATRCYAVGDHTTAGERIGFFSFVSDDGGATWELGDDVLRGVSQLGEIRCVTRDWCIAGTAIRIGVLTTGPSYEIVTVDGGRVWRLLPGHAVSDISCNGEVCLAVGQSRFFPGTVIPRARLAALTTDLGRTWRRLELPAHPGSTDEDAGLTSVECPSPSWCTAVSVVGSGPTAVISLLVFSSSDGWTTVDITEYLPA